MLKFILFLLLFFHFIFSEAEKTELSLSFAGDMMMGTDYPSRDYLPPNKGKQLFAAIQSLLTNSDFLLGNLEGNIAKVDVPSVKPAGRLSYSFRMPPYLAPVLAEAGFDAMNIANNHGWDFGRRGQLQTIHYLKANNIVPIGIKNQYAQIIVKGIKIGLLGFSTSTVFNTLFDYEAAAKLIKKTSTENNICIISFHGGAEGEKYQRISRKMEYFYNSPRGNVYRFAHLAIDMGADLVVGHGPHVLRALEIYKERFIAYSLGNFIGYARFSIRGKKGISALLTIRVDENGRFISGKVDSLLLKNRGIPQPDPENQAIKNLNELNHLDFPENPIFIDSKGNF